MKSFAALLLLVALCLAVSVSASVSRRNAKFEVVPLGVGGGIDQSNLEGFLLRSLVDVGKTGQPEYVSLDAGTVLTGVIATSNSDKPAVDPNASPKLTRTGSFFRNNIRSYLISHAHIDHIAGLVISSPDELSSLRKVVGGTNWTTSALQNDIFNWESWPNMGNGGVRPLNTYTLTTLPVGGEEYKLEYPPMSVRSFLLSHGTKGARAFPYWSTAFLVGTPQAGYVLYFGDTGADSIEGNDKMEQVWTFVAPLVRNGTLKGIFLECAYTDARASGSLFGHLKPQLYMQELNKLAQLVGNANLLKNLPVVVTHVKPEELVYKYDGPSNNSTLRTVEKQLKAQNNLNVDFIFPEQGEPFYL